MHHILCPSAMYVIPPYAHVLISSNKRERGDNDSLKRWTFFYVVFTYYIVTSYNQVVTYVGTATPSYENLLVLNISYLFK